MKYLPLFHHFKAIYQFPKHIIVLVKIVTNASLNKEQRPESLLYICCPPFRYFSWQYACLRYLKSTPFLYSYLFCCVGRSCFVYIVCIFYVYWCSTTRFLYHMMFLFNSNTTGGAISGKGPFTLLDNLSSSLFLVYKLRRELLGNKQIDVSVTSDCNGVTYSFFPHTHFSPRKNEYILSFPPGRKTEVMRWMIILQEREER